MASLNLPQGHPVHEMRARSPSPAPSASSEREDPLAPRPPGLPLYMARSNTTQSTNSVQIVDSSSARRRGGGPLVEGQSAVVYDSLPEKKEPLGQPLRRTSGTNKWAKLVPTAPPRASTWRQHVPLAIYTLLSIGTRLYRIGRNNTVVWDEAHFGKFGAYYINRTFYFDVHPPLGKMLIGFAGALTGFNGSFDYPSGAAYPDHVPYTAMRVLLALPGIAMVPLAWGTAIELRFSPWTTHIVTLMVLLDIAWLVISRFVLLDSLLLLFTFSTVYCMACFHNLQHRSFSDDWWLWLSLTGISIGCAASVKWVGLFVTALVGLYTIEDLWNKFGDLRLPFRAYVKHWIARILCLIVIPFSVYALCFKIHFLVLNHSGPGDSQMSSLFQANLYGNDFGSHPLEIAYGSKVTIKNMGYGGGLLHSHVQTFPAGSQQQQVTCYHYKDDNNNWVITPRWEDGTVDPNGPIRFLRDQDVVRLVHEPTKRNLHSHPIAAPVSKLNNEVSGYGDEKIGDSNDYWVVEVVDDMVRSKVDRIHALSSRLRFRHLNSGCYLRADNSILPQWGFKQVEVSCEKNADLRDEHNFWNVESHWNDRLESETQHIPRSPFLKDFWHLNVAMWTSNNALIPDEDKEDTIASQPLDWPFLYNGMRMNGWGNHAIKYYLIGNPFTWWVAAFSLVLWAGTLAFFLCRFQRKYNDLSPEQWSHFLYQSKIAFGGWFLEFFPFLIMGRVTYIHHYLPTLWFAVLMAGVIFDLYIFNSRRFTTRAKTIVFAIIATCIVGTFWLFRECAWGAEGPPGEVFKGLKWRSTWNIYD